MSASLSDVANALAQHCRDHTENQGLDTLYADDVVSIEAMSQDGGPRETHGLDGVRGKHAWWAEHVDLHDSSVEGPFLHGEDRFALIFAMDATERATGRRWQMKEVGIYTVIAGKITREEFYYALD